MDKQTIPWWQSRAVIGSLVTVVASIAAMVGYTVDLDKAIDLLFTLVSLAGGLASWWGRVNATKVISKRQVIPRVTISER